MPAISFLQVAKVNKFTQHLVEDLRGALQKLQAKVDKADKESPNNELLLTVSADLTCAPWPVPHMCAPA